MSLAKSAFLIRDYDNIREILRDVYIFGCYSRDDFIEKGISGRKYDNEQRRISAYLPEKFIQKRRVNKKVLLYCKYTSEDSARNYLAETYRNKSFTLLDVMSYFCILQILSDNTSLTQTEILDKLPLYNEEAIFTKDNLRIKLDELVNEGFLIMSKEGKNLKYQICDDIWKGFSNDELQDIYFYLEFLKNSSPLEVPFYFLQRKLKLYLSATRKVEITENKTLQFKHNHMFDSLDNDVLIEVLIALENKHKLEISYGNNKTSKIMPIQLVHDSVYGRQYLFCAEVDTYRLSVVRIDKIHSVKQLSKLSNEENDFIASHTEVINLSWGTSGIDCEPSNVVIDFIFDNKSEGYILERVKKEIQFGTIEKIEEDRYRLIAEVRDPMEMVPWIRSFGEHAVVISGDVLRAKMKEEWERAVSKYEALS